MQVAERRQALQPEYDEQGAGGGGRQGSGGCGRASGQLWKATEKQDNDLNNIFQRVRRLQLRGGEWIA